MFALKVFNAAAINKALAKIEKRKGKSVSCVDLADGDLVRAPDGVLVIIHRNDEAGTISSYPAYSDLLGRMGFGSGTTITSLKPETCFVRVATKADYPAPDMEKAIKTCVTKNADGTYHCQNVIHGLSGQKWDIPASELAALRADTGREVIEG